MIAEAVPSPPNKLSDGELDELLAVLNSAEFVDLAPAQLWAIRSTLGPTWRRSPRCIGRCAPATRSANGAAKPLHPARVRPELVARGPNRVWSWDISKLKGPSSD